MSISVHTLAEQARDAGLNVYLVDGYGQEHSRLRISYESTQLVVTLAWNGHREYITAAKVIQDGHTFVARFDYVDGYTDARAYAYLGWVVEQVYSLAEEKARRDYRGAEIVRKNQLVKAQRRRAQRNESAFRKTFKWRV